MDGGSRDVIFFCGHCGSAALLEPDGLQTVMSSALLPAPGRRAELWKPAWVIEAEVTVGERIRQGGRSTEGWRAHRTFVVPAFQTPLHDLVMLARSLSEVAGEVGEVPREPIRGGTLALDDALTFIRHIVVGDEVRRQDALASVSVDLQESEHRLAATPFERAGDGRIRCAISGVVVTPIQD
jgi:hypothetical protein